MGNRWEKMPDEVYHAQPELSSSQLRKFMKSPYSYQSSIGRIEKATPAMEFGTAVHLAILQPDEFGNGVLIAPECDRRTKEGKEIYARFQAGLQPHTVVLKADEYSQALAMAREITDAPEFQAFAEQSTGVELAGFAKVAGVECRIKPDMLGDDFILDYKTTLSCTPRSFEKSILTFGYAIQAAFYRLVAECIDGIQRNKFYFIAQEKSQPYEWKVYMMDPVYMAMATKEVLEALRRFALCQALNDWPKLSKETHLIELPKWFNGTMPLFGEEDEE